MISRKINFILLLMVLIGIIPLGCDNLTDAQSERTIIRLEAGKTLVEADDSQLVDEKQQQYTSIAEKLAIRYVNERDSTQTAIPDKIVRFFYSGLVHVHNSDLKEAEVITEKYRVMARAPAHPREILIWTSKSKPWVDSWRAGKTKTGIPEIDALLDEFELSLNLYREYSNVKPNAMAQMRAPGPINVYAVGTLFAKLKEIHRAGPDGLLTGGRDVKATLHDDYLLLDITVGSGDCLSGCINKISHQFHVYPDGHVELSR